MNLEFFESLYNNPEFCEALGRMTLAAGRFESNLRTFLKLNGIKVNEDRETLGTLIGKFQQNGLLSENGIQMLRNLKKQRNYLTHSLFDLFSARIDETVLPRADLVPEDVTLFTEKAWILEQDFRRLSVIAEERISRATKDKLPQSGSDTRLFRP